MNKNLRTMSNHQLIEYEQELVNQWTHRISLEIQINSLSTQRNELLEIFYKLKNPSSPENSRLINSIKQLKDKLEDIEDELDDLLQDK
ncbi:TPA: hypothetical protein MW187_003592 [Acinetobacter baumannii]|nr:hypothetical protein [Acinetobacter baumannii]